MAQRALLAAALFGAVVADAAGQSEIAFYLALAAVTAGGVVALAAVSDVVDARTGAARVAAAVGALLLSLVSAALRGSLVVEGVVPPLARTAIVGALMFVALETALSMRRVPAREARREPRRRRRERPVELDRAA